MFFSIVLFLQHIRRFNRQEGMLIKFESISQIDVAVALTLKNKHKQLLWENLKLSIYIWNEVCSRPSEILKTHAVVAYLRRLFYFYQNFGIFKKSTSRISYFVKTVVLLLVTIKSFLPISFFLFSTCFSLRFLKWSFKSWKLS